MESYITRPPSTSPAPALDDGSSQSPPPAVMEVDADSGGGEQPASAAVAAVSKEQVNGSSKRRTTVPAGQTYLFGRAPPALSEPAKRRSSKGSSRRKKQQQQSQSDDDDDDEGLDDARQSQADDSDTKENTAPSTQQQSNHLALPLSGDDADAEGEDDEELEQTGGKKRKSPSTKARGRRRVSKKHAASLAPPPTASNRPKRSSTQNVTYNVSDSEQPDVDDVDADDGEDKAAARNGKRPRLSNRAKRTRVSTGSSDVIEVIAVGDDREESQADKALRVAKQLKQKQEDEQRSAALEQQHRHAMAASSKQSVNAFALMAARRQPPPPPAEPIHLSPQTPEPIHDITNVSSQSADDSPLPNPYGHLPKGSFFMTKHERRDHVIKQRTEAFNEEIERDKLERKRIIAESGKSTHPFLQPRTSLAPPSQSDLTASLRSPRCGTTFDSTVRIEFNLSPFPSLINTNHVSHVPPARITDRYIRLSHPTMYATSSTNPLATRLAIVNHQHIASASATATLPTMPTQQRTAAVRAVTASTIDEYVTSTSVQQYLAQLAAHCNQRTPALQHTVQRLTQTYRRLMLRRLRCPTTSQHSQSATPVVLDDDGTVMHTSATDEMLWTDKYQPIASDELINRTDATVTQLKEWLRLWSTVTQQQAPSAAEQLMSASQKQPPRSRYVESDDSVDSVESAALIHNSVLLHGVTGSCKTALVYALAHELGYNVIEINSSQRRSAKDIGNIVGEAAQSHRISMPAAANGKLIPSQALAHSPAKLKQQQNNKSPAKHHKSPLNLNKLSCKQPKRQKHSLVTIVESHASSQSDSDSPFESTNLPSKLTIRISRKHLTARHRKKPSPDTKAEKVAMSAANFFGAATPAGKASKQPITASINLLSDEKHAPVLPKLNSSAVKRAAEVIELSSDSPVEVSVRKLANKQFPTVTTAATGSNLQSLILFEEVDQVFDDDAGFFSALKRFTQTAKRPIIMTCNTVIPQVMQEIEYQPMRVEQVSHADVVLYVMLVLLAECGLTQGYASLYHSIHDFVALHDNDLRQVLLQLQLRTTSRPLHVVTDVAQQHISTSQAAETNLALSNVSSRATTENVLKLFEPHATPSADLLTQTDVVESLTTLHDAIVPIVHLNYCSKAAVVEVANDGHLPIAAVQRVSLSYPLSWYEQQDATAAAARVLQLHGLPEATPVLSPAAINGGSVSTHDSLAVTEPIDLTSPKPTGIRDIASAPTDKLELTPPIGVDGSPHPMTEPVVGQPAPAAASEMATSPSQESVVASVAVAVNGLSPTINVDEQMSDADTTNDVSRATTPSPITTSRIDGSANGNDSSDLDATLMPERKLKKRGRKPKLQSRKLKRIAEEPSSGDDEWDWFAYQQRLQTERVHRKRQQVLQQWQQEVAEYQRRQEVGKRSLRAQQDSSTFAIDSLSGISDLLSFTDLATTTHLPASVLPTVERQYWRSYTRQVDYSSYNNTLDALLTADDCSDHYDSQSMYSTLAHEMVATVEVLGVQQLQDTASQHTNGVAAAHSASLKVLLSEHDASIKRQPVSASLAAPSPAAPAAHAWSTASSIMQSTIHSVTSLPFAADYMSVLRVMFRSYHQQMAAQRQAVDERRELKRQAGMSSSDEDATANNAATSRRRSSRQQASKHKQVIDINGYQLIARLVGKDLHFTEQEVEPLRQYLALTASLVS